MQHQTIFVSQHQPAPRPASIRSSILATGLVILGLMSLVTAWTNLIGESTAGSERLVSGALNFVLGMMILVSSRAVIRGKVSALGLLSGGIVLEVLVSSLTRQSLSYVWIAVALWFLWQMIDLWKEGRLQ